MAGRQAGRHVRRRLEVILPMPEVRMRRRAPGPQPAPTSTDGSVGTPKHNLRCPDDLWGAGISAAAARGSNLSAALRGYIAALAEDPDVPLYPDPTGPQGP